MREQLWLRWMSKNSWRKCSVVGLWSAPLCMPQCDFPPLSPFTTICLVLYEAFPDIDHRSRVISLFSHSNLDVSEVGWIQGGREDVAECVFSHFWQLYTSVSLKYFYKNINNSSFDHMAFFPKPDFEHRNSVDSHQPMGWVWPKLNSPW